MTRPTTGLVPVLATPFQPDGSLDVTSLRRLVEFQLAAGVDGLALFGMASEGFALSRDERTQILDTVESVTAGAVPLVAGVNATSLVGAEDQVAEYAARDSLTLMVLAPYMVPVAQGQIAEFFGTVAAAAVKAGHTVMVQDAPGATGVTMSPELIADLAALDGVTSVKVEAPPTTPKIDAVHAYLTARGIRDETFSIVGGQNAQFVLDEYACGAVGTLPACEFPDLLAPILADWNAGRRVEAREAFACLLPLIVHGLQSGYAWAVHKHVLVRRGIIDHDTVRLPARPLTTALRTNLEAVLDGILVTEAMR